MQNLSSQSDGIAKRQPAGVRTAGPWRNFIAHPLQPPSTALPLYIINATHCISSTRGVVYHRGAGNMHAVAW